MVSRSIRCVFGFHRWHREHAAETGGRYAWYDRCQRCGKEKTSLGGPDSPGPPTWF